MRLQPGKRLGPYEIAAEVGGGGMGLVYRARDTRLNRTVAIKVLADDIASDRNACLRFEREARIVASLNHPRVCQLFDVGHHEGSPYLLMEFIDGESLGQRLGRGPLPRDQLLRFGAQIAEALDAAHRRGIIHRDLKPGNIMLARDGVKVLDFGIAKILEPDTEPDGAAELPLTREGAFVGTPHYIAPEVLEGRPVDCRADIFSFGAVLYEMASGRRAFDANSRAAIMVAVLKRDPDPIPDLPPQIDRVVRRCLAKDPEDRWQTARDLADELRWMSTSGSQSELHRPPTPPSRAPRILPAAVLLVALLATAALGLWLWRRGARPPALWTGAMLGGPRIDQTLALELGFDAGFGPGTTPDLVATLIVNRLCA